MFNDAVSTTELIRSTDRDWKIVINYKHIWTLKEVFKVKSKFLLYVSLQMGDRATEMYS
jgi:hypothetical protein